MMDSFKIFYSWQSDLPNATNRTFIEDALKIAAKAIKSDDSIEVEPVIERDTQGLPGSPNIATAILEKIENADMFVCDVSIINQGTDKRPAPNPNVLIELGYALKALGSSHIVMVQNDTYGGPELLPFDLKMNRATTYSVLPEDKDKGAKKRELARTLENAIRLIISQTAERKPETPAETNGETVKRLLSNGQKIQLHDFIMQEARQAAEKIRASEIIDYTTHPTKEIFQNRVNLSEDIAHPLIEIFAEGCCWIKEEEYLRFFGDALLYVFNASDIVNGTHYPIWPSLAHYPSILLFYAGGIAALSKGNFAPLRHFALEVRYTNQRFNRPAPLISELHAFIVFDKAGKWLPDMEKRAVPGSDYVYNKLRSYFASIIPDDEAFSRIFDRFEYYLSLMYRLYAQPQDHEGWFWTPVGSFVWRRWPEIRDEIQAEIERKKENWPPIRNNLFDASLEAVIEVKSSVDAFIPEARRMLHILGR